MYIHTLGYANTGLTRALHPIMQSGLLAAVAAQLLTFFKDDSNFKNPESDARGAIFVFTYLSLLTSLAITVASALLKILCLTTSANSNPNKLQQYLNWGVVATGLCMCA
jgi:hypothetical protein